MTEKQKADEMYNYASKLHSLEKDEFLNGNILGKFYKIK